MNDYATSALIADLRGLAGTWATFRDRHGDMSSPTFCAGLEECARQLTEALERCSRLAEADDIAQQIKTGELAVMNRHADA